MIFTKQSHTIAFALCIIASAVILTDPGGSPASQGREGGNLAQDALASLVPGRENPGREAAPGEGPAMAPPPAEVASEVPVDDDWYGAPGIDLGAATPPDPATMAEPAPPAHAPNSAPPPALGPAAESHGPGPPPPGVT